MKTANFLFAALCAAFLAPGCRVRDVRTATVRTQGIASDEGLAVATAALKALPDSRLTNKRGDKRTCFEVVSFDRATGDLTVRYDSMKIGVKNIEEALARAGFDTPSFPADPKAPRRRGSGGG